MSVRTVTGAPPMDLASRANQQRVPSSIKWVSGRRTSLNLTVTGHVTETLVRRERFANTCSCRQLSSSSPRISHVSSPDLQHSRQRQSAVR